MLSGRRAIDKNRPSGEISLVEWAKPYLANKRKVFRVLDSRLEGQYTLDDAHKAAILALRCLSTEPKFRPTMEQVVKLLEELHDSKAITPAQTKSANGSRVRRRIAEDTTKSKSADGTRIQRGSEEGAANSKNSVAYPRPSASPLYK